METTKAISFRQNERCRRGIYHPLLHVTDLSAPSQDFTPLFCIFMAFKGRHTKPNSSKHSRAVHTAKCTQRWDKQTHLMYMQCLLCDSSFQHMHLLFQFNKHAARKKQWNRPIKLLLELLTLELVWGPTSDII